MTKHFLLPALAALLLAGCNQAGEGNGAANVPAAEPANADDVLANETGNELEANGGEAVLALTDRQRNAVFIRAILDAGLKCDAVTKSERVKDLNHQPTWRAYCGTASLHTISIAPDGTATINSRAD